MKHQFQKDFKLGSRYAVFPDRSGNNGPTLAIYMFGKIKKPKLYKKMDIFTLEEQVEILYNLHRPYMVKEFLKMPGVFDDIILLGS